MAGASHVLPYVKDGVAGWRVLWRLPMDVPVNGKRKTDSVRTQRFPIANGVTESEAWQTAVTFSGRVYGRDYGTPTMPTIDWKALGRTRDTTEKGINEVKKEEAEELIKRGWNAARVAKELGVHRTTVVRWTKESPLQK